VIRRHFTLRTIVSAMTGAALIASGPSAMTARGVGWPAATHAGRMHHSAPPPDLVDAAAHAATIRGIGAMRIQCSVRGPSSTAS
jgi:hypothetical protein